jgi:hypothetical protein
LNIKARLIVGVESYNSSFGLFLQDKRGEGGYGYADDQNGCGHHEKPEKRLFIMAFCRSISFDFATNSEEYKGENADQQFHGKAIFKISEPPGLEQNKAAYNEETESDDNLSHGTKSIQKSWTTYFRAIHLSIHVRVCCFLSVKQE